MAFTFKPFGGIEGLLLIEGPSFNDERGFFFESFRADEWAKAGLPPLIQDNLSRSKKGVVRGLHFQVPPLPVGKLVRCARGQIFDVAVDIRVGSPTYGHHASIELSDHGNRMFYVPPGFAHGFCALSDVADVSYKVTNYWTKEVDRGIRWNDPALRIEWPVTPAAAILTPKDAALPLLAAAKSPFDYGV
jgi:dTDP-4-dehydrorhamnose 3,5-epimerase